MTMTDKQIEDKKKFAGEKKTSMKRRDDHHNYTERRMYMITMEVEGRRPVFGRLVGDAYAPDGSDNAPRIELTELGKAVQSEWLGIHGYFPQIEVMAVQMMPDHLHGILFVKAPLPVHLGQVISGFKAGCRKAQRALEKRATAEPLPTKKEPSTPSNGSIMADVVPPSPQVTVLPSQKPTQPSLSAASLSQPHTPYQPLFASGYNDLILRSYDELSSWKNYLKDNPRRLMMKRANPDFLRPFFDLRIGSHTYSGIGNRQLLAAPQRLSVRLSRRLSESDIKREVERHLDAAKQGAVLVSPAISPGEKRVMRTVFDAGFPTIVLMENGFTPMSKPHGEQFYACAKGTLLMLSPWEHHNENRKLTSEQCSQLNLMAWEITKEEPQKQ